MNETETRGTSYITWEPMTVIHNDLLLKLAERNPPPQEWYDETDEGRIIP